MDCQKQSNGDALWDVNSYSPHTFLRIAKIVVWRCEIYGYIYMHLRGAFCVAYPRYGQCESLDVGVS